MSLIGVDYQVIIGGQIVELFGTSCSSPVFAGFISLINAQRFAVGNSSVGWLNPTLYSALGTSSSPFNDITSGSNKCCANSDYPNTATSCGASGFNCAVGRLHFMNECT